MFIGSIPTSLQRASSRPTKIVDSVEITKIAGPSNFGRVVQLQTILRVARCRAREERLATIGACVPRFAPTECRNYFRHCGYQPVGQFTDSGGLVLTM